MSIETVTGIYKYLLFSLFLEYISRISRKDIYLV